MTATSEPSPGIRPLPLLRRIELGDPIGRGNMGAVYVARVRPAPGAKPGSEPEKVAVRVLSSRFHHDRTFLSRFYADATAASRLRHPNMVHLLDVAEIGGRHLIAMELVEGISLDKWLQRAGKMPEPKLVVTATVVANVLKLAWEQQRLLHRALRPQNIFVDKSGGLVRVADLGLARAAADDAGRILTHVPASNPHYTAPELTNGESPSDCTGGIYALGATLYHLATGTMPFGDFRDQETFEHQRRGRLPGARELNPALTSGFCAVLEKMLARHPRDRYADYKALLADLQALTVGARPSATIAPGASVMSNGRPQRRAKVARVHKRSGHHEAQKGREAAVRQAPSPVAGASQAPARPVRQHPAWMTTRVVIAAWILTFVLALACFALLVRNCAQGRRWFWESRHRAEFYARHGAGDAPENRPVAMGALPFGERLIT
ncbi:MAG: serine/threonine protein kinase [Verrucomicrobiae bacterium]|nr:serine/threonine protein kinase [Verrucomicrobiae bacterium]